MVSIIIPTIKEEVETVKHLESCPIPYQLIISKTKGLGKARNNGAKFAKHDLLIFFDDDLILYPGIWKHLLALRPNHFIMHNGNGEPSTRVFAVYSKDFLGFDENIQLSGEDRDIWIRNIKEGLIPHWLPSNMIEHKAHPIRAQKSRRNAIIMMDEQAKYVLLKHGYWIKHYNQGFFEWFFPLFYQKPKTVWLCAAMLFWTTIIRNLLFAFHFVKG